MDIVERLRSAAALPTGLYAEAADEIEGLRQRLAAWRAMVFTNGDRQMTMEGRVFTVHDDGFISDNNFDFDAGLSVSGDFADGEKRQYAEMITAVLNAQTLTHNV